MKIYVISFIGLDDNYYTEHFSNKQVAKKRYNQLNKKTAKVGNDEFESEENEEGAECKQVFDLHERQCDISAKGILDYLNSYCGESAS